MRARLDCEPPVITEVSLELGEDSVAGSVRVGKTRRTFSAATHGHRKAGRGRRPDEGIEELREKIEAAGMPEG